MAMSVTAPAWRRASMRLALAPVAALACLVVACGGGPPSSSPTPVPAPIATPDPHLGDPASAQDVFNGLGRAGLSITPNTASAGAKDSDVVTKIFATYLGWPLAVVQYRTTGSLTRATNWAAGEGPGHGEPAVSIAGSNILVTWGPRISGMEPGQPDERQSAGLAKLAGALDALLSPLRARANVRVSLATSVASGQSAPP